MKRKVSRGKALAKPARKGKRGGRAKETEAARRQRLARIVAALAREYPGATCALHHRNAYELLVATILSAQCTDVRVNLVTPAVFRRFPDARVMAGADPAELQDLIRSTGFFRNKTKSLLGATNRMSAQYGGNVPDSMEELLTLPGVARKTANVILGTWFRKNEGVVVDTHVHRLSRRLALTTQDDAVKIERDLMALVPREEWTNWSHRLILHGRRICVARAPRCRVCVLGPHLCPSYEPDPEKWKAGRRKLTRSQNGAGSRNEAKVRRLVKTSARKKR